ncbi:MAG: DUF58 domain-containing protein, partial [Elusimicrobia bacterium]|nr:DUF58 domain-containing protein [Elusimicrobiota bacterium]
KRELLQRAGAAVESIVELGPNVGMIDGGLPGDLAADELNPSLVKLLTSFYGSKFIGTLRDAGHAPLSGVNAGEAAWRETYTAQQLVALRDFLRQFANDGKSWDTAGNPVALDLGERKALATAADAIEKTLVARFPDEAKNAGIDAASEPVAALYPKLSAENAAERDAARAAFLKRLDASGEQAFAAARISIAAELAQDAATRRWLADQMLARAASAGNPVTPRELATFLRQTGMPDAMMPADAAAQAALKASLDKLSPAQRDSASNALTEELFKRFQKTFDDFGYNFGDLRQRLVNEGAKKYEYGYYPTLKIAQLRAGQKVLSAMEADAKAGKLSLNAEELQKIGAAKKELAAQLKMAELLGVLPGDSPEEQVGPPMQEIFQKFYSVFEGQSAELNFKKLGLAPATASYGNNYPDHYTKEQLQKIRAAIAAIKASGQGWASNNIDTDKRPLNDREKALIDESLKKLDDMINNYPKAKAAPKTGFHGLAALGLMSASQFSFGSAWWGLLGAAAILIVAAAAIFFGVREFLRERRGYVETAPEAEERPMDIEARFDRIELASKMLSSAVTAGAFRSPWVGRGGTDIGDFRKYENEDIREINAKMSAKKGEPYINLFEQERDMPVMLLVDLSRSSEFAAQGVSKREVIEDVSATLAFVAQKSNLRVGALLFTDRVHVAIPPRAGRRHAREIARQIMSFKAPESGTDLRPAIDQALGQLKSKSIVFVVSDFQAPNFKDSFGALQQRHDVRPVRIVDPAEMRPLPALPPVSVKDAEGGSVRTVDTSASNYRPQAAAKIAGRERALEDQLGPARASSVTLSTDDDYVKKLGQVLAPKKQ